MANNYENVKKLSAIQAEGKGTLPALQKEMAATEKNISDLLKKLGGIEENIQKKKAAAAAEPAPVAAPAAAPAPAPKAEEQKKAPMPEVKAEIKPEPKAEAPKAEVKKEAPKAEVKPEPKAEVKPEPKAEVKAEPKAEAPKTEVKVEAPKAEAKPEPKAEVKPAPAPTTNNNNANTGKEKPFAPRAQGQGDKPYPPRQQGQGDRPFTPRQQGDKPYPPRQQGDRPFTPRQQGDKPYPPRQQGDRPYPPRQQGDKPYPPRQQGDRPFTPRQQGDRPYPPRQQGQGDRTYQPRQQGDRPGYGARPMGGGMGGMKPSAGMADLSALEGAKPKKDFSAPKKKTFDKTYVEKKPMNKRAMSRQEGLDIDDFDEDKTGYRKARFGKKEKKKEVNVIKIEHAVVTTKDIPIKVLSEKLGVTAVEIVKNLFKKGIECNVNGSVEFDNAWEIAAEMGIDLEYKPEKTAEEELIEMHGAEGGDENSVERPPVVTVMGHVDHGKTSLLDKIRATNVTADEAGGITQSIGAYTVNVKNEEGETKKITFIDTPGHAAFTAMRARGAKITDIVILVVAADDGIMPQTVEAINHAKAAGVPIIVAMNKMDKPQVDPDRVKNGLLQHELVPEEWGGDTMIIPVSAKTGMGIDDLLSNVLLVAEMQELKANPEKEARGSVIEAKLDKGKGPMASIIVQNGTLHVGDCIVCGMASGKVRAMFDDKGRQVKEAGPSMAVSVLGLDDVPNAGDAIFAVEQSLMKQVQEERKTKMREEMIKQQTHVSLEDMFAQVEDGKMKTLNLIVKGDVQGSVEAIKMSLEKLQNEEVKVKVIHGAAGAINESDVMLAESSNAIIIGFNVRPDTKAKALAEKSKIDVRSYRIIYELLDDIESAMKGMLSPKYQETYMGKCEVRQTFNISGVGLIAGCYVTEGKIIRGGKLRIYRDDIMIVEGNVKQLKRFKDDVKEVSFGFECGCAIEGFNEIRVDDVIECYLIEEVKKA